MFEKLIGNNEIKRVLEESIITNCIAHSYSFCGNSGVGKKHYAQEFAKNIMCLENGKCKDKCDSCIKFNTNNHPDFLQIEPEGKMLKIDQIRKMQEKIAEKPILSRKKVYIVDNADQMTEEAQNCLLKTLEEPPEYAIIILVVSNESKMLATIRSRCVTIKFSKIADLDLKEHLKELTDEQIKLLDGSFQNVDTIKQRQEEYEVIKNIVHTLENGSILDLMEKADILYNQKDNIIEILNRLNIVLLEKNIIEPVEFVEKTKRKIIGNNNYEMSIDYLLLNSWNALKGKLN